VMASKAIFFISCFLVFLMSIASNVEAQG